MCGLHGRQRPNPGTLYPLWGLEKDAVGKPQHPFTKNPKSCYLTSFSHCHVLSHLFVITLLTDKEIGAQMH